MFEKRTGGTSGITIWIWTDTATRACGFAKCKVYLAALLTMFVRAGQQLTAAGRRFQVFVSLDADDAGQDAIYVHTPNPNGQNFPYMAESTVWGDATLEAALSKLLPDLGLRVGHTRWTDDGPRHTIVIYSPRIGVPLESNQWGRIP